MFDVDRHSNKWKFLLSANFSFCLTFNFAATEPESEMVGLVSTNKSKGRIPTDQSQVRKQEIHTYLNMSEKSFQRDYSGLFFKWKG